MTSPSDVDPSTLAAKKVLYKSMWKNVIQRIRFKVLVLGVQTLSRPQKSWVSRMLGGGSRTGCVNIPVE